MTNINLFLRFIFLISITFIHANTFAVVNPVNFLYNGYQYYDEDIQEVLQTKLNTQTPGATTFVAPLIPFQNGTDAALIQGILRNAQGQIDNHGKNVSLIPINFNDSHWASLAIKRMNNGTLVAVYNDSSGNLLDNSANAQTVKNYLQANGIRLLEAGVHQQVDGTSCGAFAAENLIKIAETDLSRMNDEEIRNLFRSINNATAIRRSHFVLLYQGDKIFDIQALKPQSESAIQKVTTQHKTLFKEMGSINTLINDRLSGFSNFAAIAAGDNDPRYGVWVKAMMGAGSDEDSMSGDSALQGKIKNKNSFRGFILGADAEVSDDLILGIAFSKINAKSKYSMQGTHTNTDTIKNEVFSIYASDDLSNNLSLKGNISFGNISINSKDQLLDSSTKQKGTLTSGSLNAHYRVYSNNYIAITPRAGATMNNLNLSGYEDGSIKISKSKQKELELNAGVEIASFYDAKYLKLIPKVSADYAHIAWNKGNKINITNFLDETIIEQKFSKNKGTAKVGAGLTIETDLLEISNGYEFSTQGKSQNHLGYTKFRINF